MSALTAEGRSRIRDIRREAIGQQLRKDPRLANLPAHQRMTLGELKLVGRDLYADIKRRGVTLPDGTVNPAVEAHRKNAHEQLYSLQVFMELNRTQSSESHDLVAAMARAIETPATEGIEPSTAAPGVETPAAAPDEQAALYFAASADTDESKR